MTTSTTHADANGRCESGQCIQVDVYTGEHLTEPVVRVRSTDTDTVMQARIGEWRRFVAEVRAGDWDHIDTDYEIQVARSRPELPTHVIYEAA
jgi:hypothetical protein